MYAREQVTWREIRRTWGSPATRVTAKCCSQERSHQSCCSLLQTSSAAFVMSTEIQCLRHESQPYYLITRCAVQCGFRVGYHCGTFVILYIALYIYMYIYIYIYIYICSNLMSRSNILCRMNYVCVYVYMYVWCMYVCMYACMYR